MVNIQEIQKKRFQYLEKLYLDTNGDEFETRDHLKLGEELGFSESETSRIYDYLFGEGLIAPVDLGGSIGITHKGIVEIELSLSEPDKPTKYFPPTNIIHVEHMIGSQIQQGTNQSYQSFSYSLNDFDSIIKFVSDLKSKLTELKFDTESQEEIESDITTIESQIKSPHPKSGIIKECLISMRTILERAASTVIASVFIQQITPLI